MSNRSLDAAYLRRQIIGADSTFATPFGERLMTYCDYTASGRCLRFVESYLQGLSRIYANTHTEDDITGRSMSQLLHEAEDCIKRSVNAGPNGRIIATGTGATAAITKLQQIIGVALAPATRKSILDMLAWPDSDARRREIEKEFERLQPVVFVGPYEHHSNEISWRESLATTIEVRMDADGGIDLAHLEELLANPAWRNRLRVGSFSAASNVTGIRTDVRAISCLLHKYDALACFDFAACAPYVEIDMNPDPAGDEDPSMDAVFLSPHKFLGGPGRERRTRLQRTDLRPGAAAERERRRNRRLRGAGRPGLHQRHRRAREGGHAGSSADAESRPRVPDQGARGNELHP